MKTNMKMVIMRRRQKAKRELVKLGKRHPHPGAFNSHLVLFLTLQTLCFNSFFLNPFSSSRFLFVTCKGLRGFSISLVFGDEASCSGGERGSEDGEETQGGFP